jgi:hypothetical protein
MDQISNVSAEAKPAGYAYELSTNERKPANRAKRIAYWIVTALISFELIHGALWDFNVLNQGYVHAILTHLGYPLYLGPILGTCKLIATGFILLPRWLLFTEWAYAGLTILFAGAFVSHLVVGDKVDQSIWPLLFGLLVIGSRALRSVNRRIVQ